MTKNKWFKTTLKRRLYFLISLLGCLTGLLATASVVHAESGCDDYGLCWYKYVATECGYNGTGPIYIPCKPPAYPSDGSCYDGWDCSQALTYIYDSVVPNPTAWNYNTYYKSCNHEDGTPGMTLASAGYCTVCPQGGMSGEYLNGKPACAIYWSNPTPEEAGDLDKDGYAVIGGDCNDNNNTIFPGAPELCDGFDNDCDANTSENFDGDGDGVSECGGDCDDSNPKLTTNCQGNTVTVILDIDKNFQNNHIDDLPAFSPGYDVRGKPVKLVDPNGEGHFILDQVVRVCLYTSNTSQDPLPGTIVNFDLTDVSRHPGIAMNYPAIGGRASSDRDPDIVLNLHRAVIDSSGLACISADILDYAAWGKIKVSYFIGSAEISKTLTLPLDVDGNHIADMVDHNQSCKNSLAADLETFPVGDGFPGDGLTCAEEYRGFMVKGSLQQVTHVRTRSDEKDLFVNWPYTVFEPYLTTPGGYFGEATGVTVRNTVASVADFYLGRTGVQSSGIIINFNHPESNDPYLPHIIDQSGLFIQPTRVMEEDQLRGFVDINCEELAKDYNDSSLENDLAKCIDYTTPTYVKNISLQKFDSYETFFDQMNLTNEDPKAYFNLVVAHEIGHAVGIPHHGDDGMIKYTDEGGHVYRTEYLAHSQVSGAACIMRYKAISPSSSYYQKTINGQPEMLPYFLQNSEGKYDNSLEWNNAELKSLCELPTAAITHPNGGEERPDPTDISGSQTLRFPKTYTADPGHKGSFPRGACESSFCISDKRDRTLAPNSYYSSSH